MFNYNLSVFVQYFMLDVVKYLRFVIEVHLNVNVITDINMYLEGLLCHYYYKSDRFYDQITPLKAQHGYGLLSNLEEREDNWIKKYSDTVI